MRIEHLHIDGFGCHQNLTLTFREDLNILCGKNESGKSTVLSFIYAMLYGFKESGETENLSVPKIRMRKHWIPWQGGPFGGMLVFVEQNIRYTVVTSWGFAADEDHISVFTESDGNKATLIPGQTVGELYLGLSGEDFDALMMQGGKEQQKPKFQMLESLMNHRRSEESFTTEVRSSADNRAERAAQILQSASEELSSSRLNHDRGQLEARLREDERIHAALLNTEAEVIQLSDRIAVQEFQRNELSKKEIQPQSLDALKMSVALLERQKKANRLKEAIADLSQQCRDEFDRLICRKRPWTIILILLMVLDAAALTALLLPTRWLPDFLSFMDLSTFVHTSSCLAAGGLLLIFSLALILLRTGGRNRLYTLEEALEFRERELYGTLEIPEAKQNNEYEDESADKDRVAAAMKELEERCRHATQCLAAIDRDRQEKAELAAEISALTQRITYDCAQMDTLHRLLNTQDSCWEVLDRIETTHTRLHRMEQHTEAIALAQKLLEDALVKQKNDLIPRLSRAAGELMDGFTAGKYTALELSRQLDTAVAKDGVARSEKYFHGATESQITLSLILAEIQLLADSGLKLPVILDEPFAQYDTERRRSTLETLRRFAQVHGLQLILTSCHMEEANSAEHNQNALSI